MLQFVIQSTVSFWHDIDLRINSNGITTFFSFNSSFRNSTHSYHFGMKETLEWIKISMTILGLNSSVHNSIYSYYFCRTGNLEWIRTRLVHFSTSNLHFIFQSACMNAEKETFKLNFELTITKYNEIYRFIKINLK